MNSFAGKTASASPIHPDQVMAPSIRSNTETSYPDYAPPAYELVAAIPSPTTTSGPERPSVIEDGESTESIEQDVQTTPPRDPLEPMPSCFSRNPSSDISYEALSQPFIIHAKPGRKFLDDAFNTVGTNALEKYDVFDYDWVRLLEDVHAVAHLTKGQRVTAKVLPVTM
ncbi:unnamed protein product [Rhizoctonia solani]|uniref:Uncharacterized protein n=1 Tax=Rhizoctonia solani TaxID=456999 RepID=A0A8H3BF54_9AGAM|nr:unnamed protein product [Rhizoctonia solani]